MSATEITTMAVHSGWLAHEEKRAKFARWTRKWIVLIRDVHNSSQQVCNTRT